MRRAVISAIVLSTLFGVNVVRAQESGFGLGVAIGDFSGLTGKLWIGESTALDFAVGIDVGVTSTDAQGEKSNEGSRIRLHGDYLLHRFDLIESTESFPFHFGFGGYARIGGGFEDEVGVRLVFGIAYQVQQASLDLFFDVVPHIQLDPSVGIGLASSIGMRYYF